MIKQIRRWVRCRIFKRCTFNLFSQKCTVCQKPYGDYQKKKMEVIKNDSKK